MQDLQTQFTALGTDGSGKTCFIMGMYHKMVSGINGWTLTTDKAAADLITKSLERMDEESGCDRFPCGTSGFSDYCFKLHFHNNYISSFHWADYTSSLLEQCCAVEYENLEEYLLISSCVYVFIDGELFRGNDRKKKEKNVRRNCADILNRHITNFMKNHSSEIHPVVFVITKSDICDNDTNLQEIKDILKSCFSSIFFDPKVKAYIVKVSLGKDISEDNYSGLMDPINIHIPLFIGIYHNFADEFKAFKNSVETSVTENNKKIKESEEKISLSKKKIKMNEEKISNNKREISSCKSRISTLTSEIEELTEKIDSNKIAISGEDNRLKKNKRDRNLCRFGIAASSLPVIFGGRIGIAFGLTCAFLNGVGIGMAENGIELSETMMEDWKNEISEYEEEISTNKKLIEIRKKTIDRLEKENENLEYDILKLKNEIYFSEIDITHRKNNILRSQASLVKPEKMLEDIEKELENQNENFIMFSDGKEKLFRRNQK